MRLKDLSAEFPRESVHWRVQGKPYEHNGTFSAMALAYIDARDVMDRLDEVCGPENWQDEYVETAKGRIISRIGVKVGDQWVWKSDGAGETAVEGEKGGISDALKRAAVHWGIGRYLYRLDSPWVRCEVNQKNGNTYWKRWAEDPWSKVKQVGYTKPPEPEAETPKFDSAAARDRLLAGIAKRKTKQSLTEYWNAEKGTMDEISEPHFLEVKAAFKTAGETATDGPARQEP